MKSFAVKIVLPRLFTCGILACEKTTHHTLNQPLQLHTHALRDEKKITITPARDHVCRVTQSTNSSSINTYITKGQCKTLCWLVPQLGSPVSRTVFDKILLPLSFHASRNAHLRGHERIGPGVKPDASPGLGNSSIQRRRTALNEA